MSGLMSIRFDSQPLTVLHNNVSETKTYNDVSLAFENYFSDFEKMKRLEQTLSFHKLTPTELSLAEYQIEKLTPKNLISYRFENITDKQSELKLRCEGIIGSIWDGIKRMLAWIRDKIKGLFGGGSGSSSGGSSGDGSVSPEENKRRAEELEKKKKEIEENEKYLAEIDKNYADLDKKQKEEFEKRQEKHDAKVEKKKKEREEADKKEKEKDEEEMIKRDDEERKRVLEERRKEEEENKKREEEKNKKTQERLARVKNYLETFSNTLNKFFDLNSFEKDLDVLIYHQRNFGDIILNVFRSIDQYEKTKKFNVFDNLPDIFNLENGMTNPHESVLKTLGIKISGRKTIFLSVNDANNVLINVKVTNENETKKEITPKDLREFLSSLINLERCIGETKKTALKMFKDLVDAIDKKLDELKEQNNSEDISAYKSYSSLVVKLIEAFDLMVKEAETIYNSVSKTCGHHLKNMEQLRSDISAYN